MVPLVLTINLSHIHATPVIFSWLIPVVWYCLWDYLGFWYFCNQVVHNRKPSRRKLLFWIKKCLNKKTGVRCSMSLEENQVLQTTILLHLGDFMYNQKQRSFKGPFKNYIILFGGRSAKYHKRESHSELKSRRRLQ